MQTVHEFVDGDYPVKLELSSNGQYRITYGAEVTKTRCYTTAAAQYGYYVFHSLACAGKLDTPNEV